MKTYENIMEVNRNLDYSCLKIFNHLNEAQLHITQACTSENQQQEQNAINIPNANNYLLVSFLTTNYDLSSLLGFLSQCSLFSLMDLKRNRKLNVATWPVLSFVLPLDTGPFHLPCLQCSCRSSIRSDLSIQLKINTS